MQIVLTELRFPRDWWIEMTQGLPDVPSCRHGLIKEFKAHVVALASRPDFVHHSWYVEYHLQIVERISGELATSYPQADRDVIDVLVWLHDYGKLIDREREHERTLTEGPRVLINIGFDQQFTDQVIACARELDMNRTMDLRTARIEVQIVSSADGCAHLIGPFFPIWLWENSTHSLRELMADNLRKLEKDWNRKIVLPEARAAFEGRYRLLREQNGDIPSRLV
ncbi:hypothetical protein [Streptomyces sp. NPDC058614]|uniref:hypothetical protein n=1 Tax=Streptomyces sp. NPDC058614 TaxID=3346557 RepID=UPI003658EC52